MRTIDNYINEARERESGGRFANSGADIDPRELIKDFAGVHMRFCNGGYICDSGEKQLDKFVPMETSDGKYFLSSREFTQYSSMQSLRLVFDKESVKDINPHVFDLISTDLQISELVVYPGVKSNDIPWEGIKKVWPDGVQDKITVKDIGLTSLGDLPKPRYNTNTISAEGNLITSLDGCPHVDDLNVCDNPKLVSLAGSGQPWIYVLDASHCNLKTLAGAPRAGRTWDLSDNPLLTPSNEEVAKVFANSKMDYLRVDYQFFQNITTKKSFKDARIDELYIMFDKTPDRADVENIVKVLPLKVDLITLKIPKKEEYLTSGENFKDVRDDILSLRYNRKRPFMRMC